MQHASCQHGSVAPLPVITPPDRFAPVAPVRWLDRIESLDSSAPRRSVPLDLDDLLAVSLAVKIPNVEGIAEKTKIWRRAEYAPVVIARRSPPEGLADPREPEHEQFSMGVFASFRGGGESRSSGQERLFALDPASRPRWLESASDRGFVDFAVDVSSASTDRNYALTAAHDDGNFA